MALRGEIRTKEAEQLTAWRKANGLTQADLARMLKVSRRTVINWENDGTRLPKRFWHLLTEADAQRIAAGRETSRQRKAELDYWRKAYRHYFTQFDGHDAAIEAWSRPDAIHHGVHAMDYLARPENADILAALEATRKELEKA